MSECEFVGDVSFSEEGCRQNRISSVELYSVSAISCRVSSFCRCVQSSPVACVYVVFNTRQRISVISCYPVSDRGLGTGF